MKKFLITKMTTKRKTALKKDWKKEKVNNSKTNTGKYTIWFKTDEKLYLVDRTGKNFKNEYKGYYVFQDFSLKGKKFKTKSQALKFAKRNNGIKI